MNKDYMETEIDKVIDNKELEYPLNIAMACIWMMANFKGSDLKVLEMGTKSSLADYFILGSAQNPVQAQAMADEIQIQLRRRNFSIKSREGSKESDWVLLDTGDVIVHIFLESSRNVYDLDELWKTANHVAIPQSYYFQLADGHPGKSDTSENYY